MSYNEKQKKYIYAWCEKHPEEWAIQHRLNSINFYYKNKDKISKRRKELRELKRQKQQTGNQSPPQKIESMDIPN
jgi:hypothetical protein